MTPQSTNGWQATTMVAAREDERRSALPISTTVAYLLLFVLGIFGAHRFYLGRYGSGVVYFFTCGLFFIGVFHDIVALPAMIRSAKRRR